MSGFLIDVALRPRRRSNPTHQTREHKIKNSRSHLSKADLSKAHPIIAFIYKELMAQGMSLSELSAKAGFQYITVSRWKRKQHSPNMFLVEVALDVLGYELTVRRKTDA